MEYDAIVHSSDYYLIKGRLTNGKPFLKKTALARISALANDLTVTQAEANELTRLADKNGLDVLPDDALTRLCVMEQTADDLTLMMAEMIGGGDV